VLVGVFLSSQTKDAITAAAVRNLRQHIDGGLTVDSVLATSEDKIDDLIKKVRHAGRPPNSCFYGEFTRMCFFYQVGFHRKKAINLKKIAEILKTKYAGLVPGDLQALMDLPGIGPKMSHIILKVAFDIV
jgi:endonuclease-3